MASDDKFQFVDQNSVECWCDLGANLVQHFMRRYSRYQTVLLKLQEIITHLGLFRYKTALISVGAVFAFVGETCGLPRANTVCPYGKGGSICKEPRRPIYFLPFYGIIQLIDKLEFDGQISLYRKLIFSNPTVGMCTLLPISGILCAKGECL